MRQQRMAEVIDFLHRRHPRYIVYSSRGMVRMVLRFPDDCSAGQLEPGIEFRCIFRNSVYEVFELKYS